VNSRAFTEFVVEDASLAGAQARVIDFDAPASNDCSVANSYAHTTGTIALLLTKEGTPSFGFARPSTRLVERFGALAGGALDPTQVLEKRKGTLAALPDTLLPKSISGDLRAKGQEKIIEKIAW